MVVVSYLCDILLVISMIYLLLSPWSGTQLLIIQPIIKSFCGKTSAFFFFPDDITYAHEPSQNAHVHLRPLPVMSSNIPVAIEYQIAKLSISESGNKIHIPRK